MNYIVNKTAGVILFLSLLLSGCKKDEVLNTFEGKSIDNNILGIWTRNYSSRDINNSITDWKDTLVFENNNIGKNKIYQFSELFQNLTFQYYTEENTLFLFFEETTDQNVIKWMYSIRNDSLLLSSIQPPYSSYMDLRIYTKD